MKLLGLLALIISFHSAAAELVSFQEFKRLPEPQKVEVIKAYREFMRSYLESEVEPSALVQSRKFELLIQEAYAAEVFNCFYAGWPSIKKMVTVDGKTKPQCSSPARTNQDYKKLSQSCGEDSLACQPVLFGKDLCVSIKTQESRNYAFSNCEKQFKSQGRKIEDLAKELTGGEYAAQADELFALVHEVCSKEFQNKTPMCSNLKKKVDLIRANKPVVGTTLLDTKLSEFKPTLTKNSLLNFDPFNFKLPPLFPRTLTLPDNKVTVGGKTDDVKKDDEIVVVGDGKKSDDDTEVPPTPDLKIPDPKLPDVSITPSKDTSLTQIPIKPIKSDLPETKVTVEGDEDEIPPTPDLKLPDLKILDISITHSKDTALIPIRIKPINEESLGLPKKPVVTFPYLTKDEEETYNKQIISDLNELNDLENISSKITEDLTTCATCDAAKTTDTAGDPKIALYEISEDIDQSKETAPDYCSPQASGSHRSVATRTIFEVKDDPISVDYVAVKDGDKVSVGGFGVTSMKHGMEFDSKGSTEVGKLTPKRQYSSDFYGRSKDNIFTVIDLPVKETLIDGKVNKVEDSETGRMTNYTFFPRKKVPSIKKTDSEIIMTLTTGEKIVLDSKTGRTKTGVIKDVPPKEMVKEGAEGRRYNFPDSDLEYQGDGLVIESKVAGDENDRLSGHKVKVKAFVDGKTQECKIASDDLWTHSFGHYLPEENPEHRFSHWSCIRLKIKKDQDMYDLVKKTCPEFKLPKLAQ